jgi:hypothetical protein
MITLTDREKRTIRIAVVALAIYLVLFFALRVWRQLESRRSQYRQLIAEAQQLQRELRPYQDKISLALTLKEYFHIDPAKLSRASLVAEASAAIQAAARMGGVQIGPIRESRARASSRELTSMQLEGAGPVPGVMSLLHRLQTLGYPLIVDSVQLNSEPSKPGMVKLSLTIVILDFEQWKNGGPA